MVYQYIIIPLTPLPTPEAPALFQGAIGLGHPVEPVFSFNVPLTASVTPLL